MCSYFFGFFVHSMRQFNVVSKAFDFWAIRDRKRVAPSPAKWIFKYIFYLSHPNREVFSDSRHDSNAPEHERIKWCRRVKCPINQSFIHFQNDWVFDLIRAWKWEQNFLDETRSRFFLSSTSGWYCLRDCTARKMCRKWNIPLEKIAITSNWIAEEWIVY